MKLQNQTIFLKHASFIILAVFILFFSNNQQADAADYSGNHTYKNEALEQLIQVRDDDDEYDVDEAQRMINRIGAIPERLLNESVKAGVNVILMDFPLTDLPEYEHLKGIVPRGWEHTGLTWDDVPGAGGYNTAARIGYSEYGMGHSTINLELHEFGHSLDSNIAVQTISETDEFIALQEEEQQNIFGDKSYFDYTEEYFAEVFAYYYYDEASRLELREKAPKTYHFIESLNTRILSADNRTDTSVDLTWLPIASAETYEIYRNQELIDTVTATSYQDTPIEKLNTYYYYVKALDNTGVELSTTFETFVHDMRPNIPDFFNAEFENYNTVTLSWGEVEEAVNYILTRNDEVIARTTELSFTDSGLDENTIYEYTISVVNELNEESGQFWLSIETGTAPDEQEDPEIAFPKNPENLKADLVHYNTVALSWDTVDNADYYTIFRDGEEIDTTIESTYTDTKLNEHTTYTYMIQAVNEAGISERVVIDITTGNSPIEKPEEPEREIPETPQNLEAYLVNYNTVALSWDAVKHADSYTIFRNGEAVDTTTDLSYTDSDLRADTSYTYMIQAVNEIGVSDGEIINITTSTSPVEEPEETIDPEAPAEEESNDEEEDAESISENDNATEIIDKNDEAVSKLPATATNIFTLLLIGVVLISLGGLLLSIYKGKQYIIQ